MESEGHIAHPLSRGKMLAATASAFRRGNADHVRRDPAGRVQLGPVGPRSRKRPQPAVGAAAKLRSTRRGERRLFAVKYRAPPPSGAT